MPAPRNQLASVYIYIYKRTREIDDPLESPRDSRRSYSRGVYKRRAHVNSATSGSFKQRYTFLPFSGLAKSTRSSRCRCRTPIEMPAAAHHFSLASRNRLGPCPVLSKLMNRQLPLFTLVGLLARTYCLQN